MTAAVVDMLILARQSHTAIHGDFILNRIATEPAVVNGEQISEQITIKSHMEFVPESKIEHASVEYCCKTIQQKHTAEND
ncbi:hypothetical protein TSUD_30850 [Trifolium subterraneum]|uniref:Uncharacterized protein n=1 Tax=Trifolium subterraneum TaxID=3900 RepID=A0A2Z6M132_TRISU|nr:hypothetical protein TSUD_30850 [Trifolium subterraneum]